MSFDPVFTVAAPETRRNGTIPIVDDTMRKRILDFVQRRSTAIRYGSRSEIDTTYDRYGMEIVPHSIALEDHERTSYYDWYMNRIERGFESDVIQIEVSYVDNLNILPFQYNANWSGVQPQFELRIRTVNAVVSWFVRFVDNEFFVVLPSFMDAPWKEPIIETRGGTVEFNSAKFAKELGEHLALEFCSWRNYLAGLVKVRAFALGVLPGDGMFYPSLLTDREKFAVAQYGKWYFWDWRFHGFTSSPDSSWPYGRGLGELMKAYVSDTAENFQHPKFPSLVWSREVFAVMVACGKALKNPEFLKFFHQLPLSDDFELAVFHSEDWLMECNFYLEENQDLTGLLIDTTRSQD